jgi:hypothetical protein
MTRNTKIILLVIGGIIAILLIILVISWGGEEPTANINNNNELGPVGSLPSDNHLLINDNQEVPVTKENTTVLNTEQKQEINLERMARSFAERFGSYSNQSNFENIRDLQVFMTSYMKDWSDKYIAEHSGGTSQLYWGVQTKGLTIKSSEVEESEATIVVSTQRREISGDSSNYKTYNQDLKLVFKKVDGIWLVDGAYWQ